FLARFRAWCDMTVPLLEGIPGPAPVRRRGCPPWRRAAGASRSNGVASGRSTFGNGSVTTRREREAHRRAPAELALRLDAPAHRAHEVLHDGEPQAGTAGVSRPGRVGPVEALEHAGEGAGGDALAVVHHLDHERVRRFALAHAHLQAPVGLR